MESGEKFELSKTKKIDEIMRSLDLKKAEKKKKVEELDDFEDSLAGYSPTDRIKKDIIEATKKFISYMEEYMAFLQQAAQELEQLGVNERRVGSIREKVHSYRTFVTRKQERVEMLERSLRETDKEEN